MRTSVLLGLSLAVVASFMLATSVQAAPTWDKNPAAFKHGLAVEIDGEYYWFKGPGSVQGIVDVPGHTWVQAGENQIVGKHYNVGPWMAPAGAPWWATGEPWGVQLFQVHGIIDVPPAELSTKKAEMYKAQGYVHFHEFLDANGVESEEWVVYLKHVALSSFDFDGGPMPAAGHLVSPGVDYEFMPNW